MKLVFGKPYYKVNEFKGTVFCSIPCHIDFHFNSSAIINDCVEHICKNISAVYGTPYEFNAKGIAKCNKEEDTFDIEVGKKIAESKARSDAYKKGRMTMDLIATALSCATAALSVEEMNLKKYDKIEIEYRERKGNPSKKN